MFIGTHSRPSAVFVTCLRAVLHKANCSSLNERVQEYEFLSLVSLVLQNGQFLDDAVIIFCV